MAWIITKDLIKDETADEGTNLNAKGLIGPRSTSEADITRLQKGEGTPFRLLDDDSILYYEGRWLETADCADYEAMELQPLDDFGTPNAGATQMQYRNKEGKWETING